jgi:hypothetical protein
LEVGGALLEDGRVVRGAATLGEDGDGARWEILAADDVVSFRTETLKIFRARLLYIKGSNAGGPHYTTASGEH